MVYDAINLPWTFKGHFAPSMINLTLAIATIFAVYDGVLPEGLSEVIDAIRLDPYGGRLTVLRAKNGATVIADYAHEKESLVSIGKLAKLLAEEKGGKTLGVVRLAYDRTNELIDETGQAIGEVFDGLVVYDKIDGYWRKPKKTASNSKFTQEVGRISSLLTAAIKKTNPNVDTLLREDEALAFAATKAGANDVVIVIVNDDVERSVNWIREKFKAEFV
jgi:UDP-N-acetylmuramate-alanine ligase